MISRGELIKKYNVTLDTLRYYEKKKLLIPEHTDLESKKRYYSDTQLHFFYLIQCLKASGLSTKETTEFLKLKEEGPLNSSTKNFLLDRMTVLEEQVKSIHGYLNILNSIVETIDAENNLLEKPVIKTLKKRNIIPLKLDMSLDQFSQKKVMEVESPHLYRQLLNISAFSFSFKNNKLWVDDYILFPVKNTKDAESSTIPEGKYFCAQFKANMKNETDLLKTIEENIIHELSILKEQGLEQDGPVYLISISSIITSKSNKDWIFEIQIPIK
jgi:DNA-binding transcriptional MerR regulator